MASAQRLTLLTIRAFFFNSSAVHSVRDYDVARSWIMSQYLYHCQDCDKEFTQSLHISDFEKTEIKCPNCGGKRVHQLVAAFSAVTAKKS
jgi:putative FmdB family regulatory protein